MSRSSISVIWNYFKKSFKVAPRQYLGEEKGEDHFGNKYFELGADPQGGRRKSTRWFESSDPTNKMPDIPKEWMAWLRKQRDNPPTQEEIILNAAKAKLQKENAVRVNEKFNHKDQEKKSNFPKYPEYSK